MTTTLSALKALFYTSPYHLIIQLSPTGIFCALANMQKQSFIIHAIEHTPCTDNEITNMSIANPTKLIKLVQAFLSLHSQPNLPLLCFSSMLQPPANTPQHVLQHLLVLSKMSGPVVGLYNNTPLTMTLTSNTAASPVGRAGHLASSVVWGSTRAASAPLGWPAAPLCQAFGSAVMPSTPVKAPQG